MSKKIYELYGSDQRVIDNLKRKIRGYEKMKKDITSQNRKVNNQNRKLQQENQKYKKVINKLKQFCNNDDNFWIPDAYSQDGVYEIQEKLLDMLNEVD